MTTLTIFTPTYNRIHTIGRTYESLCRQTCKDFVWLVVDDGSTDNTDEIVQHWQNVDCGFVIQYVYKENGGLHTGYNKAIELMNTEICMCVDSDDWLPDNAVEIIVEYWKNHQNEPISGFVGKDYLPDGTQLGADFPENAIMHLVEIRQKKKWDKDNKTVMRVDLLKKVAPQPTFKGEKNFNPYYLMLKMDQIYPFRLINKNLCYVDYQQNGMAANIFNQYFNSPNSFVETRKFYLTLKHITFRWKLRQYIHFVAECHIAQRNPFNEQGVNKMAVLMCYLPGMFLYKYMCRKRTQYS